MVFYLFLKGMLSLLSWLSFMCLVSLKAAARSLEAASDDSANSTAAKIVKPHEVASLAFTCLTVKLHPWRLAWNTIPWRFGGSCSFLNEWFVGSMLIFQDVCSRKLRYPAVHGKVGFNHQLKSVLGICDRSQEGKWWRCLFFCWFVSCGVI